MTEPFRQLVRYSDRRDGFGHVAFSVKDVYETCDALDEAGVGFQSLGGSWARVFFDYSPPPT